MSFEFGIKLSYPNARVISEKAADVAILMRPFTFFGAFIGGASLDFFFSMYAFGYANVFHVFLMGILMGFFQAGGQSYNQSVKEEIEIDLHNGKDYRPTVNGKMSLREAKMWSGSMFLIAFGIALTLGVYCAIIASVMIFFAIFYSSRPIRAKRFFLINNLWQAIARGFLPAVLVSMLYPDTLTIALAFGFFFAAWVFAAQTTKDFGDVAGDKKFGIKTLPATVGWRISIFIMAIVFAYSFFALNWTVVQGYVPANFVWLNVLIIPTLMILYFLWNSIKVRFAENNLAWIFYYITLASFYMLPALLMV